ncbi:MAG TPA: hypothetical protein VE954_30950 [Oligoflexus sp.]|uniref:hypothetical protein n=1 Tax=Oligoflexus sp. TaxID=1971216 RepID=UPI002D5078F0|nr:hypothetical protein [Oligoflexus sp.]HYX37543.1 hypothetical protein [Oligoflexus sp.]
MGKKQSVDGVSLPAGQTGSTFFRNIMNDAVAAYPEEFKNFKLPGETAFKKTFGEAVVQFESYRVASRKRSEIALSMVQRTHEQLQFNDGQFQGLFQDFMTQSGDPVKIETKTFSGKAGLVPSVPFRGITYSGPSLKYLGQKLLSENKMTKRAATALAWIADFAGSNDGKIDLTGQKFVIMGASAELAPTRLLLAAGASVFWVDIKSPDSLLNEAHKYSGSLSYCSDANNILLQPNRIRASIEAFSNGDPVHIGMFAYAAGASQEWRLAATMNAIIQSLPPSCVASVAMLISPTSAAVVQPEDVSNAHTLKQKLPLWQTLLKSMGQLKQSGSVDGNGIPVARAIVPLQGVSYQAAQYISKILAAEVFATQGIDLKGPPQPLRVSANVAGITKTRSLNHPVFQAAFVGAPTFGVEIFEVPTTQALGTLLILHDLLDPEEDPRGDISSLFTRQVHGGIYSRAFALDPMIRIATLLGMAKRPKLLFKMF